LCKSLLLGKGEKNPGEGSFDGARGFHERHEEIASSVDVFEEVAKASVELYKVYMVIAERFENQASFDKALEMYHKCLEAGKRSWDRAAEGEANGKIGNLLLAMGKTHDCLPFLKQQSLITSDLGNAEGRCRACSSLAYAYDTLGLADKALSELSLVNSISEQAGDAQLQAQACKALGTLYSKVGKMDAAVDVLQKHFNLIKTILLKASSTTFSAEKNGKEKSHKLSSKDLDIARLYIGISKGNQLMGSYIVALQSDMSFLLEWKLHRSDDMILTN
jgi:tetratricopeptide (TPR) repeat protein